VLGFDIVGKTRDENRKMLEQSETIRTRGAHIDGDFGKPQTWREIVLVNSEIFTSRD
jgi:hypothetical protein